MTYQLVIISGPERGRIIPLAEGADFLIGRGATAGVRLQDPRVSRVHCQIEMNQGSVIVTDCVSAAGTVVNGEAVESKPLQSGDILRLGTTKLCLQQEVPAEESTLGSARPETPKRSASAGHNLGDLVGKTIHNYHLKRLLAQGSTGQVFLGLNVESGEDVAVKVLWPEVAKDDTTMRRFVRAMKSMHSFEHPNIVRILQAGFRGPYAWVAMEYVEGESLRETIQQIGTAGMLDWRTSFRVAVHMARALEAAFEHQIVHRNIAPQNILVRHSDKMAKLSGLMLAAPEDPGDEQLSLPGQILGDPSYLSPERTRTSLDSDCRSDIYSLGATLYALLTGRPPFEGHSTEELITKIRNEEPVRPKKFQLSIVDMFEDAVMRMLAKRPEDRFQTPTALLKDLNRIRTYQNVEV